MPSIRVKPPKHEAWEAEILKQRGLEMLLVLLHLEGLKRYILSSIRITDRAFKRNSRLDAAPTLPGGLFEVACAILVAEGVVSQSESQELLELVDYRNVVGYSLDALPASIGAYSALICLKPGESCLSAHLVQQRAKVLRQRIAQRMTKSFVSPPAWEALEFDAAEGVLLSEIAKHKRLSGKGLADSIQAQRIIGQARQSGAK